MTENDLGSMCAYGIIVSGVLGVLFFKHMSKWSDGG